MNKNGWNKILKGFVPLSFFLLLVSGIRYGLDKWSRELWSKGISLVQSLSVWLFVTPWTTAHQASLSITYRRSYCLRATILQFSSVQSLSRVRLFVTPWIAARQASLSITISRSSLRLTSIESMMPFSHLILGRPLLLLPPIVPSIRVLYSESTLHMRISLQFVSHFLLSTYWNSPSFT